MSRSFTDCYLLWGRFVGWCGHFLRDEETCLYFTNTLGLTKALASLPYCPSFPQGMATGKVFAVSDALLFTP